MTLLEMVVRGPDKWASDGGHYGAARSRGGRARLHEGVDILTVPGGRLVVPGVVPAVLERVADPYPPEKDNILLGAVLRLPDGWSIKILYCNPDRSKMGKTLEPGEVFGVAQSLAHLYPGIKDHVHVERWDPDGIRVNPTAWLFPSGEAPAHG